MCLVNFRMYFEVDVLSGKVCNSIYYQSKGQSNSKSQAFEVISLFLTPSQWSLSNEIPAVLPEMLTLTLN